MNYFKKKIDDIKTKTVEYIVDFNERIPFEFRSTITSFPFSYSIGRIVFQTAKMLGIPEQLKILIVGAAGGRDFSWLKGFGYDVHILDLGIHKWADKDKSFVGDACESSTWKQFEEKFDLIVLCDVLEHLPEDYKVLCLIRMSLKSNGLLFLSLPFNHEPEPTHIRSYSVPTLRRLLKCAGYSIKDIRFRPGPFEIFPNVINIINYGLAFIMPTVKLGAFVLKNLLNIEFIINDKLANITALSFLSHQYGCIITVSKTDEYDYIADNKKFIKK